MVQKWEENLELKIRLPDDLLAAHHLSGLRVSGQPSLPLTESECKLYLIVTLSVALTFCVLSASIVLAACVKRFQAIKSEKRRREKVAAEQERLKQKEQEDEKKKVHTISEPALERTFNVPTLFVIRTF